VVISSFLVDTLPDCADEVEQTIAETAGAEVHGRHGQSLVVTIEAPTISASQEIATALQLADGVLSVQLVYANFEDDPMIQTRLRK
jgi:nitrate reductase NapAB chaperone NapD